MRLRTVAAALLVTALTAVSAYAAVAEIYKDRFLPGTTINGIDCSEMTPEAVVEKLEEKAQKNSLTVLFRDGKKQMIRAEDVSLQYVDDGSVKKILSETDSWRWGEILIKDLPRKHSVPCRYTFDRAAAKKIINWFPQLKEENMEAPEDACLSYDKKEHRFVVVPEKTGSLLDRNEVQNRVFSCLQEGIDTIDVEKEGLYASPSVYSDNKTLIEEAETLNRLIPGYVEYILPGGDIFALDGEHCREWLVKDKDGTYRYDKAKWEKKEQEALSALEKKVNSTWKERSFNSAKRGKIKIPGGTYGYILDTEREEKRIAGIRTGESHEKTEPAYLQKETADKKINDGIGNTYVEVDIGAQHMWFYKNGKLVVETDVVTGTADGVHNTPRGVWTIESVNRNAVLVGQIQANGKPEYRTPVGYWMPFYSGCGFHDAWWRGAFGGSIYTYSGSHGCVNMPTEKAKTLLENVEAGTPVVIY